MSSRYHNEHQTTCKQTACRQTSHIKFQLTSTNQLLFSKLLYALKRIKLDFKKLSLEKGLCFRDKFSLFTPSLISTTHFLASRFINGLPPTFRALIGQEVKPEGTSPENHH